ncbi:MAG: sensor domain-containing protein [Colwellia sp.]
MHLQIPAINSDNTYEYLVENASFGICIIDLDGNYLFVNKTLSTITGFDNAELLKQNHTKLFNTSYVVSENGFMNVDQPATFKSNFTEQVSYHRKNNTSHTLLMSCQLIPFENTHRIIATLHNNADEITRILSRDKNEHFNRIVKQVSNDGIWDWNISQSTIDFDERYYTMAGYKHGDLSPRVSEWYKKIHRNDVTTVIKHFKAYMAGEIESYDVEFRFKCKDNSYMWIRQRGKIIELDANKKPLRFVGTHSDISLQKEYEHEITLQAHFDSLTFLPNRFLSLDRLNVAFEEARRNNTLVGLLFLDLDDFKKINDTLGHEAGDDVLIEAAERLRSAVRTVDTVGRLGGDEFIVILGGLKNENEIQPIVDNLLNKFRAYFTIAKRELKLTTSIGIAFYPIDAKDTSTLLRHADSAMYDAKAKGRNTFSYYTSQMNTIAQRRLTIEEQLHEALARNEFYVVYQPKVDFVSEKIMGAEALLRWRNKTLGDISPDEFIPIAEQTGFIIPLGEFVLKEALMQAKIWQTTLLKSFQIAINLSPKQFRNPAFFNVVKNNIEALDILPQTVELEITEGVLLHGHNYIQDILLNITELNIKLVMDDFGTGYSSLNYLREYSFDVLKIDKGFIKEINNSAKDKALIHAMISMSHALGIKVVAEGIEQQGQWDTLQQLGCDYGQGYLLSKPIEIEAMTLILQKQASIL